MQACARLSSSAASKRVIEGVSSTITRSCYRTCRGKAHVAPLSAQEPPPKGQKRLTKQERKLRVVEFVAKYRASNEGKFPTIKYVRQHLGGTHYTVREVLQELEYNQRKLLMDNAKAAPLHGTDEFAERARLSDESGTAEFAEHPPKDDNGKNPYNCGTVKSIQDVNDVLISQEYATTSTENMEKAETWKSVGSSHQNEETEAAKHDLNALETCENADGSTLIISQERATTSTENMEKTETWRSVSSSRHNEETEAAKHDLNASETCENADGPALSNETESGSMKGLKNEPSVSLGMEAKSDPWNQQGEKEANKVEMKKAEDFLTAHGPTVSDQSGSDNVIKEDMHERKSVPEHEPEESTTTGLFGSLKSFAYGIRNFWKKL